MRRHLAVILVACLLAAACAQESAPPPTPDPVDPNGEITTAISGEPDTIDPQKESFPSEVAQTLMVYEPLLTFDPRTLQPVPAAARALPEVSDDGLTVTFTLREGLVYSDGRRVTAADFVYGWTRLCDPNVAGDYAFVAYVITGCLRWNNLDPKHATSGELAAARSDLGVHALDDSHVVFTLTQPVAYFSAIAALWVGVPTRASDISDGGAKWTEPATFIGNGPFKLVAWSHNERLVFERNDRYRAPAKLRRWTKAMIPDPAVAAAAFRNAELDVIAAGKSDPGTVTAPPNGTFYIGFNVLRPPFDDPNVRLAFARSLDRAAYVRDVVALPAIQAMSLIAAGSPGADPADETQAFDPAAARALLASSRYAAGLPLLEFSYRTNAPRAIAEAKWAIEQWRTHLGVTVVEHPIGDCGFCQLVRTPQLTPQIVSLGWVMDYPDPQDWLPTVFRSNSAVTHTGYRSAEFDSLVDRADVERDPAKRLDLYKKAQRVLTRDAPVAFLFSAETRYLVSPRLRGYLLTASDWEFGQFTIAMMYVVKAGF